MKILVRGTNWVGDTVMSVPAIFELRRLFPSAYIALSTREWARGLFGDTDLFDEIITLGGNDSGLRSMLRQARELRERRFDLAVIFPNSFRSAAIAKLAGAKRRFGYSKEARSLLLTDALSVPAWKNERHEVFYYLNLIGEVERRLLGTETSAGIEPRTELPVAHQRRSEARKLIETAGADLSRPVVGFGPGAVNSRAKLWPAVSFAALGDMIRSRLGATILLLGAETDRPIASAVSGASGTPPIDLTGKTDLAQAAAVLAILDLFVSNDMGLAHVAAAVGTPTIAIFGPTNPVTTRPYSPLAEVVREPVECSPCMLRDCPIDHRCMIRVTPEMVFRSAVRMLGDGA